MKSVIIFGLFVALASPGSVLAEESDRSIDKLRERGYSVSSITPIFGQLLKMSYPKGFVGVFEKTSGDFYIQEHVPTGENQNTWTQMITVAGKKDQASKPGVTPRAVLNGMAGGFQRACPGSFAAEILTESKLSGFDAAVAVVSCGVSPTTGGKTSESALIAVVKGQTDLYTIQWAERSARSDTPIRIEKSKWQDRFKLLNPIKLCPIIPGERAPYSSCVGGEKSPT